MKITFQGANRTVTGSKHLIEVNGMRILLDCGMFQGKRAESYARNLNFDFDPASVDVVLLSHAHIDHSGNLPNLVAAGFRGDILCTPPTRDLCAWMLPDSGHIQERDVEFVNKQRKKRGEAPVDPIYTQQEALECLNYFVTRSYHRQFRLGNGVSVTFIDAGHMLGSASIILDVQDQTAGRDTRLVFSGDIGRVGTPIIRDPEPPEYADVLIMESTYGSRLHDDFDDSEKQLERIVLETYARGGQIVMPSFAVGRTQQLVYTLHKLTERGDIPELPIIVDSPLAVNVTSVFGLHPEAFDAEITTFMQEVEDPFGFSHLRYVRKVEDSKKLNFYRDPCIIISASGMAEFGRVLHHIKHRIGDSKNTILITGWQAENTLGRRLVDGEETVSIFGEKHRVHAQVEVINGFSGHADRDELVAWVGALEKKPAQTFLVHGEEEASLALAGLLHERYAMTVTVPTTGDEVEV